MAIRGHDPRFGEDYDHWAFVPRALPEAIELTTETWALVAEAMHALGRLDQAGQQVPNPMLLRRPTLRREAQSTSALEGTYAPLSEVLEADPATSRPGRPRSSRSSTTYVRRNTPLQPWSTGRSASVFCSIFTSCSFVVRRQMVPMPDGFGRIKS